MRSWPHSRLDLILRHGRRDYKNGSLTPGSLAETLAPIRHGVMTFGRSFGEDSVNAGLRRTELPGLEDEAEARDDLPDPLARERPDLLL